MTNKNDDDFVEKLYKIQEYCLDLDHNKNKECFYSNCKRCPAKMTFWETDMINTVDVCIMEVIPVLEELYSKMKKAEVENLKDDTDD